MAERAAVSVEAERGNVRMKVVVGDEIEVMVDFKPSEARRHALRMLDVAHECDRRLTALFGDVKE